GSATEVGLIVASASSYPLKPLFPNPSRIKAEICSKFHFASGFHRCTSSLKVRLNSQLPSLAGYRTLPYKQDERQSRTARSPGFKVLICGRDDAALSRSGSPPRNKVD